MSCGQVCLARLIIDSNGCCLSDISVSRSSAVIASNIHETMIQNLSLEDDGCFNTVDDSSDVDDDTDNDILI